MRYGCLALGPAHPRLGDARRTVHVELDGDVATVLDAAPWLGGRATSEVVRGFAEADLRAPIAPSKIVCIGRNYAAHAKELGHEVPAEPLLFLKPPSAIVGPREAVVLPAASARVEHEAELGVVLGRRCKDVPVEEALSYVLGYTVLCDVTARDLQRKDVQFTRAKGFDTFCPAGPWIETVLDPTDVEITCKVNGVVRQHGHTSAMIFPVATLIAYVSAVMTLEPGDVISTGTPEGVGPLVAGDALEISVSGVGTLRCPVR